MLVNLYKTKTPLAVFSLPLLISVLGLPVFFAENEMFPAVYTWQRDLIELVHQTPLLHYLLSIAIVYLSALELNRVVNNYGFFTKNTYLPGLVYVLVLFAIKQVNFNMQIISYGLVIFGLGYLLGVNRQEPARREVFMSSFFFGCATVFQPLIVPVLLMPWFTLMVFRPFVWREWIILFLGVSIGWIYHYGLYFFFTGSLDILPEGLTMAEIKPDFNWQHTALYGYMGIIALYSFWQYLVIANSQLLVFKKRSRLLFHMIWLMIASFVLGWFLYDTFIIGIAIPVSIIIGIQMLYTKRVLTYELVIGLWIGLILVNYFA